MALPRLCIAATSVIGLTSLTAGSKEQKVLENPSLEKVLKDLEDSANPNDKSARTKANEDLQKAINAAKSLCWIKMSESAIPGLVIGVSVDGKTVFKHGK